MAQALGLEQVPPHPTGYKIPLTFKRKICNIYLLLIYKNKSLDNIDSREVEFVQNKLNMRPRKTLKFRSPNEVFFNVVAFET